MKLHLIGERITAPTTLSTQTAVAIECVRTAWATPDADITTPDLATMAVIALDREGRLVGTHQDAELNRLTVRVTELETDLDRRHDDVMGACLARWDEEQETARLRLALKSAQRGRRELRAQVTEMENAAYGDATVRLVDPVGLIRHLHSCVAAQTHRADMLNRLCREQRMRADKAEARVAELELEHAEFVRLKSALGFKAEGDTNGGTS